MRATDTVVIEATGNCMAVSRVLSPFVARVVIANPLQVKAIAHAHVKTDKVDAGTLASLYAAGYLPEIWTPDAVTERKRRLVARRYQLVRHRTRIKNEVHAILHAHLIPPCPHADLFSKVGRAWLERQPVPDDERVAIERHVRELDRMGEDLAALDKEIAAEALDDASVARLTKLTSTLDGAVLVAIDMSKNRQEVLIERPEGGRRRRMGSKWTGGFRTGTFEKCRFLASGAAFLPAIG
nr:transposase [Sphingomonas azotifigens]